MTANEFWANKAMRFVPLATAGGNPMKMSSGMVNKEPPPATVLIKPAMKPANIRRALW